MLKDLFYKLCEKWGSWNLYSGLKPRRYCRLPLLQCPPVFNLLPHCSAVDSSTALNCFTVNSTEMDFTEQHSTALQSTSQVCISLDCTAKHCSGWPSSISQISSFCLLCCHCILQSWPCGWRNSLIANTYQSLDNR